MNILDFEYDDIREAYYKSEEIWGDIVDTTFYLPEDTESFKIGRAIRKLKPALEYVNSHESEIKREAYRQLKEEFKDDKEALSVIEDEQTFLLSLYADDFALEFQDNFDDYKIVLIAASDDEYFENVDFQIIIDSEFNFIEVSVF